MLKDAAVDKAVTALANEAGMSKLDYLKKAFTPFRFQFRAGLDSFDRAILDYGVKRLPVG